MSSSRWGCAPPSEGLPVVACGRGGGESRRRFVERRCGVRRARRGGGSRHAALRLRLGRRRVPRLRRRACGARAEERHGLRQMAPLLFERLRRGRRLLDERGVLLRDFVHLRDRLVHLLDAAALLAGRRGDLAHDVGHARDRLRDFGHRLARLARERRAVMDLLHRRVDQILDLLRRARRALREAAHFARDDREAAPLLARAGRLDGRIQRENVGLERDTLDDPGDFRDFLRALADVGHRVDDLPDHRTALLSDFRRVRRERARLLRVLRVLAHGRRQLLHAGGRFLQRRSLMLGARRQILVARRDLARTRRNAVRGGAHLPDQPHEARLHLAHRCEHAARRRRLRARDRAQIAVRDAPRDVAERRGFGAERAHQAPRDQDRRDHRRADRRRAQADQQQALARVVVGRFADHFLRAAARVFAVGVRRLDELSEQRAALVVHHHDRFVVPIVQRGVDDRERDRAVLRLDAVDVGDEAARLVVPVRRAREQFLQPAQMRLHVVLRLRHGGLFELDVGGLRHEHQIARGDRAPVHGRAYLLGRFRARADAAHVAGETVVRIAERVQRQDGHEQHESHQRTERKGQLRAHSHVLKVHGLPRFIRPRNVRCTMRRIATW
ncbi:hypothetical protein DO73_3792 [Burkholderia pseudomallei]|nr:hypothetical protein DO73_3792 [Burkholderia pseudomallei]